MAVTYLPYCSSIFHTTYRLTMLNSVAAVKYLCVIVFQTKVPWFVGMVAPKQCLFSIFFVTYTSCCVIASGKRPEASGIIGGCVSAYSTGCGTIVPIIGRGQCPGYMVGVSTANILTLTAHVVTKLCPIRIAWNVPSVRADSLYIA